MNGQIQILSAPNFMEHLKEMISSTSLLNALEIHGIGDVTLDKAAVKQILNVSSDTTLDRYDLIGKENKITGIYHKLEKIYPAGKNKPRYRFKDVMRFLHKTTSYDHGN